MDTIKNLLSKPADLFGLDPLVFGGIALVLIILIIVLISTLANMPKQRKRPGGPRTYGKVTPPNRKTKPIAVAADPAAAAPAVTASIDNVGGGVVSDLPLENTVQAAASAATPSSDVTAAGTSGDPAYDAAAYAAYYSDPNTIAAIAAALEEMRHALSGINEAVAALESAQAKSSDNYIGIRKRVKAVEAKLAGAAGATGIAGTEDLQTAEETQTAEPTPVTGPPVTGPPVTGPPDTADVSDIFTMDSTMQMQSFSALPDNEVEVSAPKDTGTDNVDFGDLLENMADLPPSMPVPKAVQKKILAPAPAPAAEPEPLPDGEEISSLPGVADYNKFAGKGIEIIKFPELSYADIMTDPGLNSPLFISGGTQHSLWVIGDSDDTRSLYPNPKNFSETETAQIYEIRGTSGGSTSVKITVLKPAVLDSWDQVNEKGVLRVSK